MRNSMKSTTRQLKLITTILTVAFSTLVASGQQRTVKGRLVSVEDHTPVPGWNIIEPGTTNATTTDVNGEFTLTINSNPSVILFAGCFNCLYVAYDDSVD